MSEHGWQQFLGADGVDDWVVLHGGATAVFVSDSMTQSAALAGAIAELPGAEGSALLLTIADARLTVRLTRDVWQLESTHIDMARMISALALSHGALADRAAVQEVQVAISAKPDDVDRSFWSAVLGYDAAADDNVVDPLGHGSTAWMQELSEATELRHAMHLDVSVPRERVQQRLAAALAAGGRLVDDSQAPAHWTLADKAGNRVCVCAWPDGSALTNGDGDTDD